MAVCLSLHGIASGFQSQTRVSILIPTVVSVIRYASRLKDMEFSRPWNTVWVNSPPSLPSLFPVHYSVLPFIPYQSTYRPHMITPPLLLINDTGTNTSITGRCTDISRGLCMMRPPLWSSGQSFWLQIQRSRVRFPALPDFSE